jgi:ATP-dependent RNA helicase SUPV3L1/SUV3
VKIPAWPIQLFISSTNVTSAPTTKNNELSRLDALTGGAFTAPTAGERSARIRDWLTTQPQAADLAEVFKELSVKDKGAAKLVRERIDEERRARDQEAVAQEWVARAESLLALGKLNIADALAWQRDAAKAGAPLSREPLATLKQQLAERVRSIEDLQHQVQVQREAAVLLAQRIEVLSTKPFKDAQAAQESLSADIDHWKSQAAALAAHASWASVDPKFPPLLEASRAQLELVWDAFQGALAMTLSAAQDPTAALPPVPVWADELRAARGLEAEPVAKAAKPQVDPAVRAAATQSVRDALTRLEAEVGEGHGKASAGAAAALRQALKEFGRLIDSALEAQAHAALAAAGELEGWQRWRADQLREELVGKAEGLLTRPQGQAMGGRKMQETLRSLREQWKQTDQGGAANHALWKRFDEACNEAHKVVEAWLEKLKAETAEHKAQRLALIAEVQAWAEENRTARDDDWKGFNRVLHQFGDRWRDAGHVGEKVFAELQPLWKQAIATAAAPLEALQSQSLAARQAMIEEARTLAEASVLRVDAVKALQQRWQAEAHRVPVDRRQEQKLWDAFRKPLDEAFNRKSAEREKAQANLNARDRTVLEAARAVEQANAGGDAAAIRAALAALEAALHGQAQAQQQVQTLAEPAASPTATAAPDTPAADAPQAAANTGTETDTDGAPPTPEAVPTPAPAPVRKPVVAVRGDDRPGVKRDTPAAQPARGRPGERGDRGERGNFGRNDRNDRDDRRAPRRDDAGRTPFAKDTPRLGDAAFRAQREAVEHAQQALRKLAAQAHGEVITQLMTAWERREATLVPAAQALGPRVGAANRNLWVQALGDAQGAAPAASEALLRLEMAAEVPTPAAKLAERRALQLQLLTRRNAPAPAQTWAQDTATVFSAGFDAENARRLQTALKALLKH